MKYINENKVLLKKYILIIVFNIILYILTSFYLKNNDTQSIIMLLLVFVSNLIIYTYNEKVIFKYYLDIITNILVGFLLIIFIKDVYVYITTILSLYLSNNIVFMKSRFSNKFIKRSLQYMIIFLITILCVFINFLVFNIIF